MAESTLSTELHSERSHAIRIMLSRPLLDGAQHRDDFRLVAGCRAWLEDWFESVCGWQLIVDVAGGFARLVKRSDTPADNRPARRSRGAQSPFDRRRYELLSLLCAELASHPITTIGLLASAVTSATAYYETCKFDSANQRERAAFVDAMKLLSAWGIVTFSSGDVDAYIGSEQANAIVTASMPRLHNLLSSANTPSAVAADDASDAIAALTFEPRYGEAATNDEQRLRWTRHSVARRLMDDPVVYLEDLTEEQRAYAAHPSGRRWLRDKVAEAGFVLEERAEGLLAIDADAVCSDVLFPGPGSNVKQVALLLIEKFVVSQESGGLVLQERTRTEVARAVQEMLSAHAGWARQYRDEDGASRLAEEATALLEAVGLVETDGAWVRPLPAICRYSPGESVAS